MLARAFEIPTVVGVEHLMESVVEGDNLVIDGNSGIVYVNPAPEVERDYQVLHQALRRISARADGRGRRAGRHARRPSRPAARQYRALQRYPARAASMAPRASGLLRSEFSFLTYEDFPDENQQIALYNADAAGVRPAPGDDSHARHRRRQVSALHAGAARGESVPRMALDSHLAGDAELFKVQLRAILRAATRYQRDASCSR